MKKTNTFIFIFIPNIQSSHMQNLVFFLKKNDFAMARSTQHNQNIFVSLLKNSNYVLENKGSLETNQLKSILDFLNQSVVINGVFFQNQILNLDRVPQLEKPSLFRSWNKKLTILL